MNLFAGCIVVDKTATLWNINYDYITSLSSNGNRVVFIFWETTTNNKQELEEELTKKLWNIIDFDMSHESENKIDIFHGTYEEWIYETAAFEGENVDINEVKDRFEWFDEAVCVREWWISERFWNKIIIVDFVY